MAACGSSNSGTAATGSNSGTGTTDTSGCTATSSVTLQNYAFSPACITVAANTAVIFTNKDAATHTSTSDASQPETFDSGDMVQNANYTFTFTKAGTTTAHCNYHSAMNVKIIVQ